MQGPYSGSDQLGRQTGPRVRTALTRTITRAILGADSRAYSAAIFVEPFSTADFPLTPAAPSSYACPECYPHADA